MSETSIESDDIEPLTENQLIKVECIKEEVDAILDYTRRYRLSSLINWGFVPPTPPIVYDRIYDLQMIAFTLEIPFSSFSVHEYMNEKLIQMDDEIDEIRRTPRTYHRWTN